MSPVLSTDVRPNPATPLLLYVEDDPAAAFMFRQALRELGLNVRLSVATCRAEAMQCMTEGEGACLPDLVILDSNLYGEDGFLVLEEMRKTEQLAHLATVIFSSSRLPKEEKRAHDFGVEYIRKPLDLAAFLERVRRICALAAR